VIEGVLELPPFGGALALWAA